MKDKTCEERVDEALESTLEDLRTLWFAYRYAGDVCPECIGTGEDTEGLKCAKCEGNGELDEEGHVEDLGNMYEYGLGFWYVAPRLTTISPKAGFAISCQPGGQGMNSESLPKR